MKKVKANKLFQNNYFVFALFVIVAFLAYSNSFNVPFNFDDEVQIVFNEDVHNLSAFSNIGEWMKVNRRPFSFFTLAINYAIGGENVTGYHIANFIIHLLTAVLLFLWLKTITTRPGNCKMPVYYAVIVSLFFLLHPVQTQSVTYIIQRMSALAGMFSMLSVYLYTLSRLSFLQKNNTVKSALYLVLAATAAVFALLSKQNAVIIPFILILTEIFFIRTTEGKKCNKFIGIAGIAALLIFAVPAILFGLPVETTEISRLDYLATQMTVIPRYFATMLTATGLSIDHGVEAVSNIRNIRVISGAAFLTALLVIAVIKARRFPLFSFGIFWVFITLSVESSIIPIRDVMFDQRMYLPLAGFSMALWSLLFYFLRNKTKLLYVLAALWIIGLSVSTYSRNNTWQNRTAVWEEVTKKYPNHFRGWQSVGRSLAAEKSRNYQKIINSYEQALKINPNYEPLWNDLATNYMKAGQPQKAMKCYKRLEKAENIEFRAMAMRAQGVFHLSKKENEIAEKYLMKTLAFNPRDTSAFHGLATLYLREKEWDKAIYYAEEYLEESPNNEQILFSAGYANFHGRNFKRAEEHFKKLVELNPRNSNGHTMLANSRINQNNFKGAIEQLQKAYDITQDEQFLRIIEQVKALMRE
jgi:tetratricopeptide (TPR) repeat protein